MSNFYDPRKKFDEDNNATKSVVWNSVNVKWATDAHSVGHPLMKSPFHDGDPQLRRPRLVFHCKKDEVIEITKCIENPLYFVRTFGKLKHEDGVYRLCELYDYQLKQFISYITTGKHIQAWSRQAAKTTTAALYMIWECMFHENSQVAILANKQKTSNEVLRKIKDIYEELPFYLKAGVTSWNEKYISFDNGCSIIAAPCTKDAINGRTIKILYLDEFAFSFDGVKEKQMEFLSNAVPVLAQVKDPRLIITSTPNGKDLFYELYDASVKGVMAYKPSTVYWWQIPNRTVEWAEEMIKTIGLEKFKVQFEMSFDTSLNKLLSPVTMRQLNEVSIEFPIVDLSTIVDKEYHSKKVRFSPTVQNINKHHYIVLIDLAEGLGGDYTVAQFLSIQHKYQNGKVEVFFRQEFVMESNDIPLDTEFPEFFLRIFNKFVVAEQSRIIIENNTYGDFFMAQLNASMNRINVFVPPACFVRFESRNTKREGQRRVGGRRVGLKVTSKIKKIAVNGFKLSMENAVMQITDSRTIEQITFFQKNKRGGYEAQVGNDDLVTPLLLLSYSMLIRNIGLIGMIEIYLVSKNLDLDKWSFGYNFDELRKKLSYND